MTNKNKNKKLSHLFGKLKGRWLLEMVKSGSCNFFAIRKPTYLEEIKNTAYVVDFETKNDYFVISTITDCVSSDNLECEVWFRKKDGKIEWAFCYDQKGKLGELDEIFVYWLLEMIFDPFEYDLHLVLP